MRRIVIIPLAILLASMLSQAQTKHSEESIIARAKRSDVSRLDSRLPRQRFDHWFKNVVGPLAKIRWKANDCGEQTGGPADEARDLPVCAEAAAEISDGRKAIVSIGVGTMKRAFSRAPGGIYYGVIEEGGQLFTIRQLGDLPEMLRRKTR